MKTVENNSKKVNIDDMVPRSEYDKLVSEFAVLKSQYEWMKNALILKNKKMFGASSEKIQETSDQLNIFNEAEEESKLSAKEPEIEEIKSYRRNKKAKRTKQDRYPDDLPVEEVVCTLDEEELDCPICEEQMHEIGTEVVRETLKIIPARAVIVRYIRTAYACRNCEKTGIEVPVIKAPVKNSVIKGSFAAPETVAHIMTQKYVMDVPLYRQEADFKRKDIYLLRQTLANWMIKASKSWLQPIFDRLREKLLESYAIHADETTIQVLNEPGKKPQSKSYMWLYRTGEYEDEQIALYDYKPGRNAKFPQEFLSGYSGYIHCDGYEAYRKINTAIIAGCNYHARRKFFDAFVCMPEKDREGSKALIGLNYFKKLAKIEEKIKDLPPEEKLEIRQKESAKVYDEFYAWMQSLNLAKQSPIEKAVNYTLHHFKDLKMYLTDGRLNISNNPAEHLAKSFAVARKNFLFSNSPAGATASAVIMSIVETAKINEIDPYMYLNYIFHQAPQMDMSKNENIEKLLPNYFKEITQASKKKSDVQQEQLPLDI